MAGLNEMEKSCMTTENMGKKRYGLDTSTKARLCSEKKRDSLVVHIPIFSVTVKIHLQSYTTKQESYATKQRATKTPDAFAMNANAALPRVTSFHSAFSSIGSFSCTKSTCLTGCNRTPGKHMRPSPWTSNSSPPSLSTL
jgi:hypothetical protein